MRRRRLTQFGLIVLALLAAACSPGAKTSQAPASVQSATKQPTTAAEIAAYQGSDRSQMLEGGARLEGRVSWYTSLAGDVVDALAKGFEQKYPAIKVDASRPTGTNAVLVRVSEEYRAKKYNADVVETPPTQLLALKDEVKALTPFYTPEAKDRPAEAKFAAPSGLYYWVADRESYIGFAYNTKAIPETAVPKTYKDLLNPALKGKMALSAFSGISWLGNLISNQGEGFAQQFAKQDVRVQEITAKAVADLIVSGEIAASPTIYEDHAKQAIEKGAPLKWVPLEPVTDNAGALAIIGNAPHPHAAVLFADFLLGSEGQKILERFGYGSPTRDPGFARWIPEQGPDHHWLGSTEYGKKYDQWQAFLDKQLVQK